jgi:hypothetical protein
MDPDLAKSLGSKTGSGDRTDQFTDWGGDIGGPIREGPVVGLGRVR